MDQTTIAAIDNMERIAALSRRARLTRSDRVRTEVEAALEPLYAVQRELEAAVGERFADSFDAVRRALSEEDYVITGEGERSICGAHDGRCQFTVSIDFGRDGPDWQLIEGEVLGADPPAARGRNYVAVRIRAARKREQYAAEA